MSGRYVGRRLLLAVPTLLGLSLLIFALVALAGDPAQLLAARSDPEAQATGAGIETIQKELGLDQPLPVRYARWLGRAVQGDLGHSIFTSRSVAGEILRTFPATVVLASAAIIFVILLAVPMGVIGAMFHGRWGDQTVRILALVGASIPGFFLAYVLIDLLAVRNHVFPVAGIDGLRSVVLPAFVLALGPAVMVSRLLRTSLVDVLGEDYIRTARGKGLAAVPVMFNHAVRNALLPIVTVIGAIFGRLLEGAVIIEVIFNWPGIGNLTYNAVLVYDYPLVAGTVLFGGAVFIVLNLLVDLSYGFIDPRVRVGATAT